MCRYNSRIGMNAMCVHTHVYKQTHTNVYTVSVTGCHCLCDYVSVPAIPVGALHFVANSVLMPRLSMTLFITEA